jgi:hypothetical protein
MYDTYFVLLHGFVFQALNTTNILYRRGKLPLNNLRCENPAKMKILQVRLRGGEARRIGQSLRDSLQVELDPLLSSQHCTHLELNLAQCTLSSQKMMVPALCFHQKTSSVHPAVSLSQHWFSAPFLHQSIDSVHSVIIRALVQCILPLSRHCLSATYRYRNFGSVHPSVLITALFQCIKSLSQCCFVAPTCPS